VQQQTTTQPVTEPPVTTQKRTTIAQNTMPPATEQNTANRSTEAPAGPAMPHRSAGWLMMLLSGGARSGIGAKLRSKR